MKIQIQANKSMAESLKNRAEITLQRLDETDICKYPSNTLVDYYDIIHQLMEAISITEGIKFKGDGAHQQLIDYIAEKLFPDRREFLQNLREFRNRISYEGFNVKESFIRDNNKTLRKIIKTLGDFLCK